jgi:hypothetical protein
MIFSIARRGSVTLRAHGSQNGKAGARFVDLFAVLDVDTQIPGSYRQHPKGKREIKAMKLKFSWLIFLIFGITVIVGESYIIISKYGFGILVICLLTLLMILSAVAGALWSSYKQKKLYKEQISKGRFLVFIATIIFGIFALVFKSEWLVIFPSFSASFSLIFDGIRQIRWDNQTPVE